MSICFSFINSVPVEGNSSSNKKPKFGPKVATQAWWIENIRKDPIYQYTEEWAKHSEYQVARWKILAELDYKVLGTSISGEQLDLGRPTHQRLSLDLSGSSLSVELTSRPFNFGPGWKQPSL